MKTNVKAWDLLLPHAEFAYNKALSKTTGLSPFKVVYGVDPLSPLVLVPIKMNEKPNVDASRRVEEIQRLHEMVKSKIAKANASYQVQASKHKKKVVFHPGDVVWVHLRKERFPSKCKSKIMHIRSTCLEIMEFRPLST